MGHRIHKNTCALIHDQYGLVRGRSWHDVIALVRRIEAMIAGFGLAVEARTIAHVHIDTGILWQRSTSSDPRSGAWAMDWPQKICAGAFEV